MRPIIIDHPISTIDGRIYTVWPTIEHLSAGLSQEQFETEELAKMGLTASAKINCKPTQLPHEHAWAWSAWKRQGDSVVVDIPKAKEKAHELRRKRRDKLMEPLDKLTTSPVASIKNKAMVDKQTVMDNDALVQVAIDAATTEEQMRLALANYQAV